MSDQSKVSEPGDPAAPASNPAPSAEQDHDEAAAPDGELTSPAEEGDEQAKLPPGPSENAPQSSMFPPGPS